MQNVIFVAPFALEATLRFLRPAVELSGVRLAVIGQEPAERLFTSPLHWNQLRAVIFGMVHVSIKLKLVLKINRGR